MLRSRASLGSARVNGNRAVAGARRCSTRVVVVRCANEPKTNPKIVIIGGTGRVGASTASALLKLIPEAQLTLSSRNQESFTETLIRRPDLKDSTFKKVDVLSVSSVLEAILGADLVIHTAGPFQRTENHSVIEAAIAARVPYIDVCDDTPYSEQSKNLYSAACVAAGIPAIISAGIYPGTSNVMAAHILSLARKEYDEDMNYQTPPEGEGVEPSKLMYSYYTAGSGGAGPTILATTFLLAGEEAIVYREGKKYTYPPLSNRREVDFGPGVGRKGVYLYNLPEVESAHKYLRVPGVSTRFGTDPFVWNWLMWLMARLIPRFLLNDVKFAQSMAKLSDPLVRTVDKLVGEAVAMRIEIDFSKGKNSAGLFVHKKLSESMGYSVAAFADSILQGNTDVGVWYPEEQGALKDRRRFFSIASTGCDRFDLNKSAWSMESDIKQIGGLIYW
ncbi:MAG: hypothetical protein WDW38_003005 [Sanguina aurantia]